jgi:hypothetical protein
LKEHGEFGLTLAEGKQLFECVQHEFVAAQAEEIVARARTCRRCGRRLASRHLETMDGSRPFTLEIATSTISGRPV